MPQANKAKVKKPEEQENKEAPTIEVPSLADILMSASPKEEAVEQAEPTQPVEDATKLTMSYLMKKDRDRYKMLQETIKILPELAKSENPLAAIMLEKLMEGGSGGSSDVEEIKDLAKAMSYTVVLPELMKDVVRSVRGSGGDVDKTTMLLLQALEERDRRLQQLIQELKEERESKLMDEVRKEMYEALSTVVDTFSKNLQDIQQQVVSLVQQSSQNSGPSDPFDIVDLLIQYEEKAKQLLEKRGYKVIDNSEMLDKLKEQANLDIEKQIKLKELELKEKEIQARNQLYSKLGEAMAKFAENPDNILRLIDGLLGIFRRGPPTEEWRAAVDEASNPNIDINMPNKTTIPSIKDFLGGANGGGE